MKQRHPTVAASRQPMSQERSERSNQLPEGRTTLGVSDAPEHFSDASLLGLQRLVGNQAVGQLLSQHQRSSGATGRGLGAVQRLLGRQDLISQAGQPQADQPVTAFGKVLFTKAMSTKYKAVLNALDVYQAFVTNHSITADNKELFYTQMVAQLDLVKVQCQQYVAKHKTQKAGQPWRTPFIQNIISTDIPTERSIIDLLHTSSSDHWRLMVGKTYKAAIADEATWATRRSEGYTDDRIFADFLPNPIPYQGWKLHVTTDSVSAAGVAGAVLPVLRAHNINHKIVATVGDYEQHMTGGQLGKYITIYPDNDRHAPQIVAWIDAAVTGRGFSGPLPAGERAVGTSGLVSSRWGAFTGPTVRKPFAGELRHLAPHLDGMVIKSGPNWMFQPGGRGNAPVPIKLDEGGRPYTEVPDERSKIKPDWVDNIW